MVALEWDGEEWFCRPSSPSTCRSASRAGIEVDQLDEAAVLALVRIDPSRIAVHRCSELHKLPMQIGRQAV